MRIVWRSTVLNTFPVRGILFCADYKSRGNVIRFVLDCVGQPSLLGGRGLGKWIGKGHARGSVLMKPLRAHSVRCVSRVLVLVRCRWVDLRCTPSTSLVAAGLGRGRRRCVGIKGWIHSGRVEACGMHLHQSKGEMKGNRLGMTPDASQWRPEDLRQRRRGCGEGHVRCIL